MGPRIARATVVAALVAALTAPILAMGPPAGAVAAADPAVSEASADPDVSVAYQMNARHDGHLASGVELPPLSKAWARDLGGWAVSYPIVADGKVFVTSHVGPHYGTTLFALDATTGLDMWAPIDLGGTYYFGGITYGEGRIFALNLDGVLRAVDARSGQVVWTVQLIGQYYTTSPPTYRNGLVFVSGGGFGGNLFAVSALDGHIVWQQRVQGGDHSSPAVSDTAVYVTYFCSEHYAFAPATGAPLWHNSAGCVAGGGRTPVLAQGRVWTRENVNEDPLVLDAGTGATTGSYRAGPAPAFAGEVGYFLDGGVLEARNASTHALLWSFSGDGQLSTAPIVVNGYVYVGSTTGRLWALDASTGTSVWSDDVGASIRWPDEGNATTLTGLGAGQGLVVVPAHNMLVAYSGASGPTSDPIVASVEGGTSSPEAGRDPSPPIVVSGVVPGETVRILQGGSVRATRTATSSSPTVTFNANPSDTDVVLTGDGDHALVATATGAAGTATGAAGDAATSPVFVYTLDTVAPPAPRIASVLGDTTSPAPGNDLTPSVAVAAVTGGDTVTILEAGTPRGSAAVAAGASSVTLDTTPLDYDGDHVLAATATDRAGNVSAPSAAFVYALDATGPTAPTIVSVGGATTSPAVGADPSPTIALSGLVAGDQVHILDGDTVRATRTVPAGATTMSFNVGSAADVVLAQDGKHVLAATATDPVGNDSSVSRFTYTLTTTFAGEFHALSPTRILDTRDGTGGVWGPLGSGATLAVTAGGPSGVPAGGVSAVVLNVTAVQPTAAGFLTVFPGGTPRPTASNLNFVAGQTVPNLVVAKVGSDGKVNVYNHAGSTHLVLDVVGWYSAADGGTPGARYTASSPARIVDTRDGTGGFGAAVGAASSIAAPVMGRGGVPAAGVSAVVLNVTAVQPTAAGFLTVFPGGGPRPTASNLNFVAGQIVPNLVVAKVGGDGKVNVYNHAGSTHLVLDVVGWFGTEGVDAGTLFRPVAPARLLDTRDGTGGFGAAVGAASSIAVPVTGRGGVPAAGVSAVVLNVTAVQPTAAGFLTVFPGGGPRPTASNLNFVAGQIVPNLVVAKVGSDGKVNVYNHAGSTHVIFDVVGWYAL